VTTTAADAAALRTALAQEMTTPASPWYDAFATVPRHVFVPAFLRQQPDQAWRLTTAADDTYWPAVYSDTALTTQLTGSDPTSSSSQPSLMLAMLEALETEQGHQVLEIGTGTGYNTALLGHLLGDKAVTTVDVDPSLTGPATDRLAAAGHHPHVHTGDGTLGVPGRAPFDRIMATCGMTHIPPAWIEQSRDGAVILAPVGWGLARLTVRNGGAEGRFLPGGAYFMPRRIPAVTPRFADLDTTEPHTSGTTVTTDLLDRLAFPLSLALPGYRSCTWSGDGDEDSDAVGIWTPDGSVARAHLDGTIRQAGPRALWDEVETLAHLFPTGQPEREDFGLTVTPETQHAWYGTPDGPSWPTWT
ncbi:methyltransferase domain-containing protein, partial [Streptomyces sp. NPDC055078]